MNSFQRFLENHTVQVIEGFTSNDFFPLDLSETNPDLNELKTSADYDIYLEHLMKTTGKKVAFGGYLEKRNLYKRSAVFKETTHEERSIHLGMDLWVKAGTTILAAFDGEVHSFQFNNNLGDYGPTIILKHTIENFEFYTLYGHLSLESLTNLYNGKKISKGEVIAQLGSAAVNGDYAPHLHFQIIKDLQGKKGDYPGVANEKDVPFYKENCPDPNLVLKIIS